MRINEQIIKKIEERMDAGARKYGETIDIKDDRDFLEEAIEEALDDFSIRPDLRSARRGNLRRP